MIYFDNAATSWPKPPGVAEAMTRFLDEVGANPGRAAHRQAVESGRILYDTREGNILELALQELLRDVIQTPDLREHIP